MYAILHAIHHTTPVYGSSEASLQSYMHTCIKHVQQVHCVIHTIGNVYVHIDVDTHTSTYVRAITVYVNTYTHTCNNTVYIHGCK